MSSNRVIVPVDISFEGGLNLNDDPQLIEDNEMPVCLNFDLEGKKLVKRPSFEGITSTPFSGAKRIKILGHYKNDNNSQLMASVEDVPTNPDKIYYSNDGGATWTEATRSGVVVNSFFYKGYQYGTSNMDFVDTLGNLYTWDGSNLGVPVVVPSSMLVGDVVLDRLFLFDYRSAIQTVRYSDPANFTSWPAANSFNLTYRADEDQITAMVNYKDKLVIFRKFSIWVLYMTGTPVNWQLRKFIQGIGNTGLYSVCEAEDWLYFIGHKGVYRTNLSTVEEISGPFKKLFKTRRALDNDATGSSKTVYGMFDSIVYHENKIICSINFMRDDDTGAFTRSHRMFVFHIDTEKWTEYLPNMVSNTLDAYNAPTNMISISHNRQGATYGPYRVGVYGGCSEHTGQLFRYSRFNNALYSDVSGQYSCKLRTKTFTFDSGMELKKIPYKAITVVNPDSDTLMSFTDVVEDTSRVAVTKTPGTLVSTSGKSIKLPGPGYVRQYAFEAEFSIPNPNVDTLGFEVIKASLGVRLPRPVQTNERV